MSPRHHRRHGLPVVPAALFLIAAAIVPLVSAARAAPERATVSHALSMYGGDVKYPPGFKHFEYVEPRAPKGGIVKLAAFGTFDTLNPFILKGVAAGDIGLIFDTLLVGSADEAFTEYGLITESIEVPADRTWVAFTL